MSELDKVYESKIKHSGIFKFSELYEFLYDWFVGEDYFVTEKVYKEKITPKGKEIEVEWLCTRIISDYFRFRIKVVMRVVGLVEVEVVEEGKKIKTNKGSVEIKMSAFLEKDWENRWEENAFLKFLRGIYDKYVIHGRIEQYEDKLASETYEALSQVKSFLALESRV